MQFFLGGRLGFLQLKLRRKHELERARESPHSFIDLSPLLDLTLVRDELLGCPARFVVHRLVPKPLGFSGWICHLFLALFVFDEDVYFRALA
jgi:hypothetical protein